MDPVTAQTTIAPLLRDFGPYGGWALTILALVWAVRGLHQCQSDRVRDAQVLTQALTEAKGAVNSMTAALESRKGYFERFGEELEATARDTRQELQMIRQSLDDIRRSGRP